MKRLLAGLVLTAVCAILLSPRIAHAAELVSPGFTYQAGVSSITMNVVSVSTGIVPGATQVDSPQIVGRVILEIQNIDSTANLWCLAVSTTPTTNNGRKIAPGSSWIVGTLDKYEQVTYSTTTSSLTRQNVTIGFWCESDGAAATKAVVTQMY